MTKAVDVLLEATPAHINLAEVEQAVLSVEGVASVHDLHVRRLASGIDALSAHVVLKDGVSPQVAAAAAMQAATTLKEEFRIDHSTIQLEDFSHRSA
jgi:cobalt-zinc-cadmium efflux system protein